MSNTAWLSIDDTSTTEDLHICLHGSLDFTTVPNLWSQLREQMEQGKPIILKLHAVTHANSAALALLLEAIAQAAASALPITIQDIPSSLLDLARLSNVENLLRNPPSTLPLK